MTRASRPAAPPTDNTVGLSRGDLNKQTLRKRGTDDDLLLVFAPFMQVNAPIECRPTHSMFFERTSERR